ncbi:hypothetical protein [Bradyrhizobium sp. CB2312]|uniref:hypothetical protein n=1 Tax=Bradyrhizobium sp. CB2312 TaxID=3039155 RepID=UPI0024B1EC01|nr:hypothetical protein [Bradyrhizobium sp. CB2312]WFU74092.1 hypothetical protein QA642_08565 [Bradyrhizobium sp. CB2312]
MSRDLRLKFKWRHRHEMEAAQTDDGLEPERIISARARWHDANGAAELRNAFRWLLK